MKSIDYRVALMLGGNLGDTRLHFSEAIRLLSERIGKIDRLSSLYNSEPWGLFNQPPFKNQAVVVITGLTANEILRNIKIIEAELGRIPGEINGPREIDIDILLFEEQTISEKDLEIPHPRLHLRNFNLVPLAEIAPDWIHPVFNRTIFSLMEDCTDTLPVKKIVRMKLPEKYRYIVVEGNIGAGKTSLARKLAIDFGGTPVLEEFAENSFLPQFYRDPEKFAFPLELSFLAARYKQLTHNIDLLENRFIISDYHIRKSLLFAEFNLAPEELRLFESFYEIVTSRIPEPDLVIYLDKGVEKLQTNIISRGRQFENEISSGYLYGIQHSYHDLIKKYPFNRLVIIDSENMDFVNNENDYNLIINKLVSLDD